MKNKKTFARFGVLIVPFLAFALGCAPAGGPAAHPKPAGYTKQELNEQLVLATLWMQQSAEYRALCYQAYNIARQILDKDLKENPTKQKRAIIVDNDETTIQANEYEGYLIGQEKQYPEGWFDYVADAKQAPIPGSVEFLNYAKSKGVETFYVTNRKVDLEDKGTLENLKKFGFPYADLEHISLRRKGEDDNKAPRQAEIAQKYHVVMLIGDNLDDVSGDFWHKTIDERFSATDANRPKFGIRYVVLPNPMYGTWERAILNYNRELPAEEQNRLRKSLLRKWK